MYFDNLFKEVKIREVIIISIISILISLIGARIVLIYLQIGLNETFINFVILFSQIILCTLLFYKLKISLKTIKILIKDFKNKFDLKEILKILVIYFLIAMGAACIEIFVLYLFSPISAMSFITESPIVINNKYDLIIYLLYIVVFIPVNDELVFRHIFLQRLSKKFSLISGIIATSLLYASLNICLGVFSSFIMSIINCIQYIKYKNISIPIVNKVIINIIAVIITIPVVNYCRHVGVLPKGIILKNALIGILVAVIGIVLFVKYVYNNKDLLKNYDDEYNSF